MAETLPHLLIENARKYANQKVALREKQFGIWQSVTWQEYLENVRDLALGLVELGYEPGDKLAILGDNRPEWLYCELAIQCLGGRRSAYSRTAISSRSGISLIIQTQSS